VAGPAGTNGPSPRLLPVPLTAIEKAMSNPTDRLGDGELLLELLCEEMPARMQRRACDDLKQHLDERLQAHRIRPANITGYVTPRRLTVIAVGIPKGLPPSQEERRGPRVGAPQPAIDGFLRSAGLASIEDCEIRDTGRGEFYFAVAKRPGRPTPEVLPDLIYSAIIDVVWSKSMRWPGAALRWVRPLTSILCVYDGAVVSLAIEGVPVGRATRGHRFLSPGRFCVSSAAEYLEKLPHAYVVLDPERRREQIRADLDRRAAELGVSVKTDFGLLDEVTGLAEFPVVLAGAIDPGFMTLPPEVLEAAMRTHQRYFSCVSHDGRAAPHFLFVADNLPEDGGASIVAGNERVLRARLADARFFWDQDRKIRLEDRVEALNGRVYHAKLGSVYDKTERIERLADFLAGQLYPVTPAKAGVQGNRPDMRPLDSRFRGNDNGQVARFARRAAHLAKTDLSTGMVGEFPELQGVVGRYYALADGEDPRVADAIAAHYKPVGPDDLCPSEPVSIIVSLADKIDALAAFFAIGEVPTGSRDPFALRRAAQAVIRLILENRLKLALGQAIALAILYVVQQLGHELLEQGSVKDLLLGFIGDRLNAHLRERGVRYDLVAAVFSLKEDDLVRLRSRVEALRAFLDTEDGANLLTAYRRASNIVSIEERRDNRRYDDRNEDPEIEIEPEERALSNALGGIGGRAGGLVFEDRFEEAMAELARLRQPVDEFFDKVTVNTADASLRENRLRLLARIRDTMNRVADFSRIEG
jgi:glycyl-tRNA synthetase beta chain